MGDYHFSTIWLPWKRFQSLMLPSGRLAHVEILAVKHNKFLAKNCT